MDLMDAFLGRNGLLPHGFCLSNSPGLLWSMVLADGLIALAYFSIPLAILRFMKQRKDLSHAWLAWLFSGFIFTCGVTHVMDIWTLWQPDYALQSVTKAATAGLSMVTAFCMWRLIPQAVALPTPAHLRGAQQSLLAEAAQRRSVEEQLAETQQSLAVSLASIGAGFIATDREGHVTRMNSVAERLLGWSQAEAGGRSVWQVFDREGRPADFLNRNPVDVLIEEGYSVEVGQQIMALSRDGRRTPMEVKAAATYGSDGSVRGMAIIFRDLTRALLAEAESGRLAAIVESSNDAIIGKTLDGRITSWNRAAQQMFGYTPEQILGQPVQWLIPADRQIEEMRILTELARGAAVAPFDTLRRARDGRLLQVSLSVSPIRNNRGEIVGASKIARDVTAQRAAEAALRESESQLRFTLESAQIGEWAMDLDTGEVERSVRHDRCFGYDRLLPRWTREDMVAHVHPEDRADLQAAAERAIVTLGEFSAEFRVVWPDGSTHWLQAHATVRHDGGLATRLLGIVIDISAKKLAEQARLNAERLEAENRQIQAASALKSQFLANMSHELRTPLNAVIGFADLLRGGVVSPQSPKHNEYLGHIASSGRHLLQLINDVLDLSKIEAGRFDFYPEPLQLERLIVEVCDVLAVSAQRKGVHIAIDVDSSIGELVLDRARLKQVLYNYLSNAIKFSHADGEVLVRARPEGTQRWRLEVQDHGIGIAHEDLPRLFKDFQQLDTGLDKQHEGTGLGLALTRRLIEAQGGRVGVVSERGAGSTFFLVLDRVRSSDELLMIAPGHHASPDPQPAPVATARTAYPVRDLLFKPLRTEQVTSVLGGWIDRQPVPARVLVVDDDPLALSLMHATLAGLGITALCVADPRLALRDIDQLRPDAMVLDLMMPGCDGFAVLHALQQMPHWRELPVFIWTSLMLSDDELQQLRQSARAILHKGGADVRPLLDSLERLSEAAP